MPLEAPPSRPSPPDGYGQSKIVSSKAFGILLIHSKYNSRLVNLVVAGLMVFGGIVQFFPLGIQSAIIGSYVCLFGAGMHSPEALSNPPILENLTH